MNRIIAEKWSWIEAAHRMRAQLLDLLSDTDLTFYPGGRNMTLGALCRQIGETEYSYIQSLKTFTQTWSYRNSDAELVSSVSRLRSWFHTLDGEMQAVIETLSDEEVKKPVDRGGFPATVEFQLDTYLQALLIFMGKATIFLRAMDISLPQAFEEYIG
jgi:hypothetical protein